MRGMLIALLVGAAVIAGCGGGDDNESAATPAATATQAPADNGGGGGGGATVKLSAPADGALKFDQADATATAGKVTVDFSNPSQVPHAVGIKGNGVDQETTTVTSGDASLEVDLKPGTYEFFCPVPGHEAAGMKGTLTVQ